MAKLTKETIPDLLVRNIPREIIMGIEEALVVGAQRAYVAARGMHDGHLPSVVGQLRHFHMNESFQRALAVNDASPSPIRGNAIVTGRTGVFTLARFNIKEGIWVNGRRSQTRRQMSMANKAIEPLVQPELFADYEPPSEAVVFFVACFAPLALCRVTAYSGSRSAMHSGRRGECGAGVHGSTSCEHFLQPGQRAL